MNKDQVADFKQIWEEVGMLQQLHGAVGDVIRPIMQNPVFWAGASGEDETGRQQMQATLNGITRTRTAIEAISTLDWEDEEACHAAGEEVVEALREFKMAFGAPKVRGSLPTEYHMRMIDFIMGIGELFEDLGIENTLGGPKLDDVKLT